MDPLAQVELATGPEPQRHASSGCTAWAPTAGTSCRIVRELPLPEGLALRFVFPHAPDAAGHHQQRLRDARLVRHRDERHRPPARRARHSRFAGRGRAADRARARRAASTPTRIVLAGFSQGGAIALQAGLRHAEALAGIVALSTYLTLEDSLDAEASAANRATPDLHGPRHPGSGGPACARGIVRAPRCASARLPDRVAHLADAPLGLRRGSGSRRAVPRARAGRRRGARALGDPAALGRRASAGAGPCAHGASSRAAATVSGSSARRSASGSARTGRRAARSTYTCTKCPWAAAASDSGREEADLVAHARASHVRDPQRRRDGTRIGKRREVVAARLHHQPDHCAPVDVERAALDEPRVHHGVEEGVVDDVVHVAVGVVVEPAGGDGLRVRIVRAPVGLRSLHGSGGSRALGRGVGFGRQELHRARERAGHRTTWPPARNASTSSRRLIVSW